MKIVPRYILREHVGPLIFALSALTSLLLLNFVAKRFGDLVGKGLPWSVIAEFLLLSVPFTVAMTLPMAVLVATLHAFSRLASENEITAFKASGVSMHRLVRPVIFASLGMTCLMVWFNDQVLPNANHRLAKLQGDIARVKPTLALQEQVINEVVRGQLYLRAARIDGSTNQMRDVMIYDLSDPTRRRTILADSGNLSFTPTGEDLILTLHHGNMVELTPQTPERLQRSFFTEDLIKVRGVSARLDRDETRSSYKSDREMSVCELMDAVRRSELERRSAWDRLRTAEGDGTRADLPPRTPGGIGALYCKGIAAVQGLFSVKEAEASQEQRGGTARQDTFPVRDAVTPQESAPTRDTIAPADRPPLGELRPESEIAQEGPASPFIVEGLQAEYRMTQAAIDQYRVEIEKKFAIATACFVFVLLGAPIALRFPGGGVGLTIGVSLVVFGIYYIGLLGGEALADRNLVDPTIAMWITNILLGAVGAYLTVRLGSEGSTARGSETSEWWGRVLDRFRKKRGAP